MSGSRRRVLRGLGAGASLLLLGGTARLARGADGTVTALPAEYPFHLGVASGFPTADSVVLWTRLAIFPGQPAAGLPPLDFPLRYELAEDEGFRRIIARGDLKAEAALSHSARVQVQGLRPARDYWYRFTAGQHTSAVGRTRTLPAARDRVAALRIAVACCQHYEAAYYAAWRHAAAESPDLIVHVGDYIYATGPGNANRGRRHDTPRCHTLEDYRRRYALYKSDPALQAAHLAAPWFLIWDDHEVQNNYSGETSGRVEEPALYFERRAAAYQAWFENMPVPPSWAPRDGRVRVHGRVSLGSLAELYLLDQRQYRSAQACPRPPQLGGLRLPAGCAERLESSRSMLGMEQERWLAGELRTQAAAPWTLLAQGTQVSHMNQGTPDAVEYWSDGWTGYPAARQRLVESLQQGKGGVPVVLSGDIHAFIAAGIHAVPERADTPLVAAEFGASSISSDPIAQDSLDAWRAASPGIQRLDGRHRGYLSLTLTPRALRADLVGVVNPLQADSPCRSVGSHVIEAGNPRIQPA